MAHVGDLYVLKLNQTFLGQQALNVFGYKATVNAGNAADLALEFNVTVLPQLKTIQSNQVNYNSIEVINADDLADYDILTPTTASGELSGDALPSYVAWTYKYARSTRAVRNGFKRFAGVTESVQVNGVPAGLIVAALNSVATTLFSNMSAGGPSDALYVPQILRVTYPKPNPTHLPGTYTGFGVSGVTFEHIGTQNTRKAY